jgi:hypothetical protein
MTDATMNREEIAAFLAPQATLLRPWPKRLAPAMLNSSKSCDTYSLTKPAYLAGRRAATKISAIFLSPCHFNPATYE